MKQSQEISHFIEAYNDIESFPTIADVAANFEITEKTVTNKASILKGTGIHLVDRKNIKSTTYADTARVTAQVTPEMCIDNLKEIQQEATGVVVTLRHFRNHSELNDQDWEQHFGTFAEFKKAAGAMPTRAVNKIRNTIAKHSSVDHYRGFNAEKEDLDEVYLRDSDSKYKTLLACSDMHDKECDPFYLRTLIDTARRVQPDVICMAGDIFDLPEFGKYTVDPREWDVVGRIKFVHEKIFAPLREACPDAQMDLISGNHEMRCLIHLSDATPALRSILSDLHGFTIQKLLGLDRYKINFITKEDLSAYSKTDIKKEVSKNYRIYWDSILAHHFPQGKSFAIPGFNGHHHSYKSETLYNPSYGSYQWVQLGAGHTRRASFCEGEKWSNGFAIVNCNTETKSTNFDYISVGADFAVSAGKWYYRQSDEILAAHFK